MHNVATDFLKGLRVKCGHKAAKRVGSTDCTEIALEFDSRQQLLFDETSNSQKRFVQIFTKNITNITVGKDLHRNLLLTKSGWQDVGEVGEVAEHLED